MMEEPADKEALFTLSRKILKHDLHYADRWSGLLLCQPESALHHLKPGDVLVRYTPQLVDNKSHYNEYLLHGVIHIALVVQLNDQSIYKIEFPQNASTGADVFSNVGSLDQKSFSVVLRCPVLTKDSVLLEKVNRDIMLLAGYEDHQGRLMKRRIVPMEDFLRTHQVSPMLRHKLPKRLYCGELAYLAYALNGISLCQPGAIEDLIASAGGLPHSKMFFKFMKVYLGQFPPLLVAYGFIWLLETCGDKLGLKVIKPTRHFFRKAIFPRAIFESPALELVLAVPPPQKYLETYRKHLAS